MCVYERGVHLREDLKCGPARRLPLYSVYFFCSLCLTTVCLWICMCIRVDFPSFLFFVSVCAWKVPHCHIWKTRFVYLMCTLAFSLHHSKSRRLLFKPSPQTESKNRNEYSATGGKMKFKKLAHHSTQTPTHNFLRTMKP